MVVNLVVPMAYYSVVRLVLMKVELKVDSMVDWSAVGFASTKLQYQ
jgi:hypothetical protein